MATTETAAFTLSGAARIDDAVLPLLVSQAAIEFDCAIRGVPHDFVAATKLGKTLLSFAGRTSRVGSYSDPIAVGLVALAMQEAAIPEIAIKPDAERTAELGEMLAGGAQTTSSAQWTTLRDFCVSFARQLVDYRQSLKLMRPENPTHR